MLDGEHGGFAADLEVQVWFGRVAGVAEVADHLSPLDAIADLDLERSGLDVGVEGVEAVADVEDKVVAAELVQLEGVHIGLGCLIGSAVDDLDHGAVSDGEERFVVAEVGVVGGRVLRTRDGRQHPRMRERGRIERGIDADPIDGEALERRETAGDRQHSAAMRRRGATPVPHEPLVTRQRRRQRDRLALAEGHVAGPLGDGAKEAVDPAVRIDR